MKILATAILGIFLAIAAIVGTGGVQGASAQCASSNSVTLSQIGSTMPTSADGFLVTLDGAWDTQSTPFILVPSVASGTIGISDVMYIPAYAFPQSCHDSQIIFALGIKTGAGPHLLNTLVQVGLQSNYAYGVKPVLIP